MSARNRLVPVFLSVLALVATATAALATPPDDDRGRNDTVPVIVLHADEEADPQREAREIARDHDAELRFVYEHALRGFSAEVPEGRVEGLSRDPRVRHLERDQTVSIAAQSVPTGVERIFADDNTEIGIDGSDDTRVDADVAVIDTGIDLDHEDLDVVASTDCTGGGPFGGSCGSGGDDDNGHGTHVAGTAAALDNGVGVVGVAPGARLHAVKVLRSDGSGYISWIVAGIDYVTERAGTIDVANMSLGCECDSDSMDEAIASSVGAGITYAVAAGNSDDETATYSPANHPDVITVSALADFDGDPGGNGSSTCRDDQDDTLADFSNYDSTGTYVDIAAPGVCILSAWNDGGYHTISGTSMASPHGAGAAALLASTGSTPSQIETTLESEGNFDWVDDSGDGVHEPLLDVSNSTVFDPATVAGDGGGDGGGETNSAPTADFSHSCTDFTCDFTDLSSDSDGSIAGWDWDFGDGATSTEQSPTHTYGADGTYTVSLTVTDDDGATDTTSQEVTVSDSSDDGTTFTLDATGYKVKGVQTADLTWTNASGDQVDVYRDNALVDTTANDGAYTDSTGQKGGGSATYQVCETGTTTCSNEATATF